MKIIINLIYTDINSFYCNILDIDGRYHSVDFFLAIVGLFWMASYFLNLVRMWKIDARIISTVIGREISRCANCC
jgi:hypothetical protein